jgi:hypothetical protein
MRQEEMEGVRGVSAGEVTGTEYRSGAKVLRMLFCALVSKEGLGILGESDGGQSAFWALLLLGKSEAGWRLGVGKWEGDFWDVRRTGGESAFGVVKVLPGK